MKITKNQLRRIIKEEKAKLLRESITDMTDYENLIIKVATQLTDNFGEDMLQMAKDDPGVISTSFGEWEQQVVYAQQEMENALQMAIEETIQEIESRLHNGDYYEMRGR